MQFRIRAIAKRLPPPGAPPQMDVGLPVPTSGNHLFTTAESVPFYRRGGLLFTVGVELEATVSAEALAQLRADARIELREVAEVPA